MKFLGNAADALQGAAQKRSQVGAQPRLVKSGSFKRGVVIARQDPGLIGDARRIGTKGEIVSACLNDAQSLPLFLLDNVAENAAFFAHEVLAAGAQLVEHAPRNEHGRGKLRRRVAEFLPGTLAVVLEETDILDAWVALQVEDAFGGQAEKVCDLIVAGVPQMP